MFCSNCGTKGKPGARFCADCGQSLDAAVADSGLMEPRPEPAAVVVEAPAVVPPKGRGGDTGLIVLVAGLGVLTLAGLVVNIIQLVQGTHWVSALF